MTKGNTLPVTQKPVPMMGGLYPKYFDGKCVFREFFQTIWKMHKDCSSFDTGMIIPGIIVTKKSHYEPRKMTQYI